MHTRSLISHILVALQFTGIALVVWPFSTPSSDRYAWLAICAAGLLVGLYTIAHNRLGNFGVYPEPLENACLVTSGPYRWIRHPMYASLLLVMLGIALFYAQLPNYAGLVMVIVAVVGKMHREERHLHLHFEDYSDYVRRTHRLLPGIY